MFGGWGEKVEDKCMYLLDGLDAMRGVLSVVVVVSETLTFIEFMLKEVRLDFIHL